jgi:hydrogenase nickel incorporation protein HypB
MCDHCGCPSTGHGPRDAIPVMENLLSENDHAAEHNRQHFNEHGVLVVNLMSSPGSGKTSLLEATIRAVSDRWRVAVIEGDLETENDAERIRRHGVPAVQITTGAACHLDAGMVHRALDHLPLAGLDILFIENVGNLVCPASFDLGQHVNVVLLSVTEGDDKPQKYPIMFRSADHVLLTKADLQPHIEEFSAAKARRAVARLSPAIPVTEVSAKTAAGLDRWLAWLEGLRRNLRAESHQYED